MLTRATYAGGQRFAATWTGDNTSTWNHFRISMPNLLNLGLSGYALVGDDIGGFIGAPPPDLLTRWIELGAFNPIFRNHAATDTRPHEAWVDGPQHEALRRQAIELRYRLMPYVYTAAEENSRTGLPIMRPVFLQYPQAETFYSNDRDFLFGADLFVAPVSDERLDSHQVTLPPGEWYEFGSSRQHVAAKDPIKLDPRPATTPLYARAGAIVPMQAVVQHTGERPAGPLQLQVYLPRPGGECSGSLYQDDGVSQAYQDGAMLRMEYACEASKRQAVVTSRVVRDGFAPWWSDVEVTVYGVGRKPSAMRVDGQVVADWNYDAVRQSVVVVVRDARRDWRMQMAY